jgi:leucyl aminopeptidase (aminopeptidase T)
MRNRNRKIKEILDLCDRVVVQSENGSNFEVGLVKKDNTRRIVRTSDSDARQRFDPRYIKEKRYYGTMANIPGGEAFVTPEYVEGKIVGDVVISLDKSYPLKKKLIINATKGGYKIIGGEKHIVRKIYQKRKDAWKQINRQEKTVPKEITELKKRNFNNIGEFAINTNSSARLCDYLIVNEKIANMIHVALGSGFESDKSTEYHIDVVINAPAQRLDIVGKRGKKNIFIMKKGRFSV